MESVKNYISGVKIMHYLQDVEFSLDKLIHLDLGLKGSGRKIHISQIGLFP